MAPRQRVRVTGRAGGDPAAVFDVRSLVVGAARRCEARLGTFGDPAAGDAVQRARPVAETGAS